MNAADTTRKVTAAHASRAWIRWPIAFLSIRKVSALCVWVVLVVVFAIGVPDTFLTLTTLRSVLSEQAVTAILAVGLVVPLAAGGFDLSGGFTLGLGVIVSASLTGVHGASTGVTLAAALGFGFAVGAVNGLLVTRVGIDSFIATLGVGSCISALIGWISDNQTLIGLPDGFQRIATREVGGIQMPVFYLLAIALVLWFVLEHTPLGRHVYAIGGNADAARLSGLPTRRIVFASFAIAGVLASFAGVLLCARSAAGSPNVGPTYLLPAFAAVFLGSTQFQTGRFNVWGTVVAVYVLATGVKGLQLAGAPFWIPDLFNGLALLIAVSASKISGGRLFRARGRSVEFPGRSTPGADVTSSDPVLRHRESAHLMDP
jgi:ribose transport system permease protein